MPLVSILIVAYNPGMYLKYTLQSCIEQTYTDIEILILDNAGEGELGIMNYELDIQQIESIDSDNEYTYRVKSPTGDTYIPIRLWRSDANLGPYGGLNSLLERATGQYIAVQDHDDIWHPEKIQKQVQILETHTQYVGVGTRTMMYYEGDGMYFDYYLGVENTYTIHPSLMYRKISLKEKDVYMYPIDGTTYMCDAFFMKYILCEGEKRIYNIDETLTMHIVKAGATNYSYRWHTLSWVNLVRAYTLHPAMYATATICWEILRKCIYPILHILGLGRHIDILERVPFRMMGYTMHRIDGYVGGMRRYIDSERK